MKSKKAKKTKKGALVQEKEAEANQTQRRSLNSLKVLTKKFFLLSTHFSWLRTGRQI